jgi:hypothetical protein
LQPSPARSDNTAVHFPKGTEMKCSDAAILKKQSRDIDWVPKDNPGIRPGPVRNGSQVIPAYRAVNASCPHMEDLDLHLLSYALILDRPRIVQRRRISHPISVFRFDEFC